MIEIIEFFKSSDMAFFISYIVMITTVSTIVFLSLGKSFATRRTWIVGSMLVFLFSAYLSVGELLGRPKPIGVLTDVMPLVKEATILGAYMVPDKAMYLTLIWAEIDSPRLLDLPWDPKLAKQIQGGLKARAEGKIKKLTIRRPFERSYEKRPPVIYPEPWPMPPAKTIPPNNFRDLNEMQRPRPRRGPR